MSDDQIKRVIAEINQDEKEQTAYTETKHKIKTKKAISLLIAGIGLMITVIGVVTLTTQGRYVDNVTFNEPQLKSAILILVGLILMFLAYISTSLKKTKIEGVYKQVLKAEKKVNDTQLKDKEASDGTGANPFNLDEEKDKDKNPVIIE